MPLRGGKKKIIWSRNGAVNYGEFAKWVIGREGVGNSAYSASDIGYGLRECFADLGHKVIGLGQPRLHLAPDSTSLEIDGRGPRHMALPRPSSRLRER